MPLASRSITTSATAAVPCSCWYSSGTVMVGRSNGALRNVMVQFMTPLAYEADLPTVTCMLRMRVCMGPCVLLPATKSMS